MNTGLTLRTIHVKDGLASVRAGATLLYDSDPAAEEAETELKASAFLDVIRRRAPARRAAPSRPWRAPAPGDASCSSTTRTRSSTRSPTISARRVPRSSRCAAASRPRRTTTSRRTWSVLSPGPGTPSDFDVAGTIEALVRRGVPAFGVCLGLQGMVEYCGGTLGVLELPDARQGLAHPRAGRAPVRGTARRVHRRPLSLALRNPRSPAGGLQVTAETEDGVVMAIEHTSLPLAAVQFHPESIMTLGEDVGLRLLANVLSLLARGA